jgi:hypothetical protein
MALLGRSQYPRLARTCALLSRAATPTTLERTSVRALRIQV